jgi:hypothetical protein
MSDMSENETLSSTETAFSCAIFGAWLPYFISQFMSQKRGLHGNTAYINAVIMLSTTLFHL